MENKSKLKIVSDRSEIIDLLESKKSNASKKMICMYSSILECIITDPLFMSVTMEDKIIHRGYSIFDTTKIFGNKLFNIDSHIERLLKSIDYINLKSKHSPEEFKDILLQTAIQARKLEPASDIDLRFFYSAGLGNFSVQEVDGNHTFYVLAIRADNSVRPINGTQDFLVNKQQLKKNTSKAKTTNYLENCIINKSSKSKGGYLGIICDDQNNLLESPISNIAFVNDKDEFVVPSFEKSLRGTTVTKCMDYIEKKLMPEGLLKGISREDTNLEHIKQGKIKEAFFLGGDFLCPLLEIEGIPIISEPGKIARILQQHLSEQKIGENTIDLTEFLK